ncbi:MAG: putative toxin-antitoxin system toxin component, PIN family [Phycisphaerae bacterium]|nr:putative toxin-antitoxin system toxin component, PIN family [Phycisphaerae bacterium]
MKLVLDTNVLIAAFITHGTCNELLEYCAVNHEVVLSPFILKELKEKLTQKFQFTIQEADAVIHLLRSRFAVVAPRPLEQPICRDPEDDNVLGTALAGHCECIVTGDKDLLALHRVQGIRLVSPSHFWATER